MNNRQRSWQLQHLSQDTIVCPGYLSGSRADLKGGVWGMRTPPPHPLRSSLFAMVPYLQLEAELKGQGSGVSAKSQDSRLSL